MRDFIICVLAVWYFAVPAKAVERHAGAGWSLSVTRPAGDRPFPAVIILPGCSGNDHPAVAAGLRDHARRLTDAGYVAAILNVLQGASICSNLQALATREVSAARAATAAAETLAADKRIDPDRIGLIGQSFGGSVALRVASRSSPFRAVVAYYPWCRAGGLRIPALIMTGSADTWTPISRCMGLGATTVTYPGAVHSFDLKTLPRQTVKGVEGMFPVEGNRAAAAASQARYLSFFARVLR